MKIPIAGLVLFFGMHAIPMFRGLRGRLESVPGPAGYKGAFSPALSGAAIVA